jgi:DNA-binding FadR family transcriptional regulator
VQLAHTITDDQVERLREFLKAEEGSVDERELHSMHDFHVLVAELTGNPALQLFVASLTNLTQRQRTSDSSNQEYLHEVHFAHGKIADAIIGRDPSLARHRMVSHLEAVASVWAPRAGNPVDAT